jgi:hypothetical protein
METSVTQCFGHLATLDVLSAAAAAAAATTNCMSAAAVSLSLSAHLRGPVCPARPGRLARNRVCVSHISESITSHGREREKQLAGRTHA